MLQAPDPSALCRNYRHKQSATQLDAHGDKTEKSNAPCPGPLEPPEAVSPGRGVVLLTDLKSSKDCQ